MCRALQDQTLRVSNEVRRLSHGLHPSVIADFGLGIALEAFCEEFERSQGIPVRFNGLIEDSQLDPVAATCLYRIAQESMRNAVVHGQATQVQVELSISGSSMQLLVRDNGVGFSPGEARTKTGLGVISMRERIRLVDGTFRDLFRARARRRDTRFGSVCGSGQWRRFAFYWLTIIRSSSKEFGV